MLQGNAPVTLPDPISGARWVQYRKQHDKATARGITSTEIAVRVANSIEQETKKVTNEIACESRRGAESQGGTTVRGGTGASTPAYKP